MSNIDDPVDYLESIMDASDFLNIHNLDYAEEDEKIIYYMSFSSVQVASLFKLKLFDSESQTNQRMIQNTYKNKIPSSIRNIRPDATIKRIRKALSLSVTRLSDTTVSFNATVPQDLILETKIPGDRDSDAITQYPHEFSVQSNVKKLTFEHIVRNAATNVIVHAAKKRYKILEGQVQQVTDNGDSTVEDNDESAVDEKTETPAPSLVTNLSTVYSTSYVSRISVPYKQSAYKLKTVYFQPKHSLSHSYQATFATKCTVSYINVPARYQLVY